MDDRSGVTRTVGANSKNLFREIRVRVLAMTNALVTIRLPRKCSQLEGIANSLHSRSRENSGVRDAVRTTRTFNSRSIASNDFAHGLLYFVTVQK